MSEFIVKVPDEESALFIARFGTEGTTMFGYRLAEEIVRCMDCTWFANDAMHGAWCKKLGVSLHDDYDGFCAWGAKAVDK
jgi:hypothetical protein